MRVLVCGSRTFSQPGVVDAVLFGQRTLIGDDPDFVIIEGGAKGADRFAREWAIAFGRPFLTFPADWESYGKYAGLKRNQQMLDEGKPDVVWAFVDKPLEESKGTAHMVTIARKAGVPVRVVSVED